MSLSDDITKFCKDLILGDFEENPGNAAMVVGGLISLIPIADQVLDARDVSGMLYRLGRKGPKNATKDDWVDLALAGFGVIPEVGSLFKTIVKPLWKGRKAMKGAMRGEAFIGAMLGKHKGKAITFMKTFNWAGNTQMAINSAMQALDGCDLLLAELSESHWWLPDDLQAMARDLRPGLKPMRKSLKSGIQQGSDALKEFVTDMLGEDGYAVAQVAMAAVGSTASARGHNKSGASHVSAAPHGSSSRGSTAHTSSGSHNNSSGMAATKPQKPVLHSEPAAAHTTTSVKPVNDAGHGTGTTAAPKPKKSASANQEQKPHIDVADTKRQVTTKGQGNQTNGRKKLTEIGKEIGKNINQRFVGLIGEHMAHYHHMGKHAAGAWPHGVVEGSWKGSIHLVDESNRPETPVEIIPEHIKRIFQNGVDGIWSFGNGTYHFVEAKAYLSAGSLFGSAVSQIKKDRYSKRMTPPNLSERQLALWYMLGQPKKGLQMSEKWLKVSLKTEAMKSFAQLKNRFVYVFFEIPTAKVPVEDGYVMSSGGSLKKLPAPDMAEHLVVAAEVARRYLISNEDTHELALHDQHKGLHDYSDSYNHEELDQLTSQFNSSMPRPPKKPTTDTSSKPTRKSRNGK